MQGFQTGTEQNDIKPIRLWFYESGQYQQQYRTGIMTNVDGNTLNRIDEITQGGTMLQRGVLNSIANDIIVPANTIEKRLDVMGGWNEKRFRFLLEVEITNRFGGHRHRKVITGWTSHMGMQDPLGNGDALMDQNMLMYINNDITLRDTPVPSPDGLRRMVRTERVSSDHILLGSYDTQSPYGQEVSLRPEDITANIATGATIMSLGGGHVNNTYAQFVASPIKLSSRQNESPTHYLSKILGSYREATNMYADTFASVDTYDETFASATGLCKETSVVENLFLDKLRRFSGWQENGYFTLGDMGSLFPDVAHVLKVFKYQRGSVTLLPPPQAQDSATFDNKDATSLVMNKIMNALGGMLFDCLLSSVGFIYTNDTPGCRDTMSPIDPKLFGSIVDNINLLDAAEQFRMRFLSELAPSLTHHGQVSLTIKMISHVCGNTELVINYNHTGDYTFHLPTFCDTLGSPMVSTNGNQLQNISKDIQALMTVINNQALVPGTFVDTGAQRMFNAQSKFLDNMFEPASLFEPAQQIQTPVLADQSTHSQKIDLF